MEQAFSILGYAELVFVTCFFCTEAVRLALRTRIARVEREWQVLPDERYNSWIFLPYATAVTGVGIAIGAAMITAGTGIRSYAGLLVILVSVAAPFTYLRAAAAAPFKHLLSYLPARPLPSVPRLLPSARFRRALAENGAPVTADGLAVRGAVLAVILAAVLMRRVRHRRDLADLGRELVAGSQTLLNRLSQLTPAVPSSPARRPSGLRRLWKKAVGAQDPRRRR